MLVGCATNHVEYDSAKLAYATRDTVPSVATGKHNGVRLDIVKSKPYKDDQYSVDRETWLVYATNTTPWDLCINVEWQLMDFEFYTDYQTNVYLRPQSVTGLGAMIQKVWVIDGVELTPDASGYATAINTYSPDWEQDIGYECNPIVKEQYIEER